MSSNNKINLLDYSLDVSIVIYKHSEEFIFNVIKSLKENTDDITRTSIFIVDNFGSFSFEFFLEMFSDENIDSSNIKYKKRSDNPGYSVSNNMIIKHSNADFFLILNPDVFFNENAIYNALNYLISNEKCLLVSPKIKDEFGVIVSGIKRFPSLLVLILRFLDVRFLNRFFNKCLSSYECRDVLNFDEPQQVEIASGCCMLFKTSMLKRINGFDERFFLYFEDFDLSIRAKNIGEVHYLPSFVIVHHGGNTGKKSKFHIFHFLVSMVRFYGKYGVKFI